SFRNLKIFEVIETGECSLREVAADYEISPTRVQQIVQQVRRWLRSTAGGDDLRSPRQMLLDALYLFDERLKCLARAAYEAWHFSKGNYTEVHVCDGVRHERTKRSTGDPRHLASMLKIEKERLESAVAVYEHLPKFGEPKASDRVIEGATTPCAPDVEEPEAAAEMPPAEQVASDDAVETFVETPAVETPPEEAPSQEVSPPVRAEALKLNRKERRRRLALLKKKLKSRG